MNAEKSKFSEDLSKCVLCGGCKASCPTFEIEGLESMGARGRIALIRGLAEGELNPSLLLNERIFSCILCGACAGTCPLGVDIPGAVLRARALLHRADPQRKYLRSIAKFSSRWPELSFRMLRMGRHLIFPALLRRGVLPFIPDIPMNSFSGKEQVFTVPGKRGRVAVFTGCSVNFLFPHLGESLIRVLNTLGYEVVLPSGVGCCGTPLRALGMEEEAVRLAKKNLRVMSRLNVEAVLSLCPTCTLALKNEYPKLLGEGLDSAQDISAFLNSKLEFAGSIEKTAIYHDPCHLYYGLGIRNEPREIIRKAGIGLAGSEYAGCCGFGGLFSFSYRDLSGKLLKVCSDNLLRFRPDAVITSCPGCMLQLSQRITDRPVLHLIEVIEEAYCERPSLQHEAMAANP